MPGLVRGKRGLNPPLTLRIETLRDRVRIDSSVFDLVLGDRAALAGRT